MNEKFILNINTVIYAFINLLLSFELCEKSVNLAKKKLESMSLREKIGQMTQANVNMQAQGTFKDML